ncbi:hypothetical protein D3Y57_05665 [Sphingomonas paeninsulae]|uniref:Uncharacterized protein n=1 Tax=Sphingomonas paeninsulae TaxID=2319844 RepID=A0A494T9D4_SPHPE|nr:hypothetical protein [Sphingomonas paeninsulae]AYJ85560.1 hypothetical protein D3Y57_05665 [Sphingomonas paeninsulae]
MDNIFQAQRIAIADLCNPMEQVVRHKKFIDCEILGPANILIINQGTGKLVANSFSKFDAVIIANDAVPSSAIAFLDCDFERCTFYNVVLLFQESASENANNLINGMHWITPVPASFKRTPTVLPNDASSSVAKKWKLPWSR